MTRVVLTQPAPRVSRLADRLRASGHEPLALGQRRLVRSATAPEPRSLLDAIGAGYDWVVFVSPGAVGAAFDGLADPAARWPDTAGAAVVGPGSAQALAERGIAPPRVRVVHPAAAPYDAAALLRTPPFDRPESLRVLVVHGEGGRTGWIDTLGARGARVDVLRVYRSEPVPVDPAAVDRLRGWAGGDAAAVFVFTSAGAVRECEALLAAQGLASWAHAQRALAVHPRIVAVLQECGWRAAALVEPGEQALLAGIESA